jgi:hypothetical protein
MEDRDQRYLDPYASSHPLQPLLRLLRLGRGTAAAQRSLLFRRASSICDHAHTDNVHVVSLRQLFDGAGVALVSSEQLPARAVPLFTRAVQCVLAHDSSRYGTQAHDTEARFYSGLEGVRKYLELYVAIQATLAAKTDAPRDLFGPVFVTCDDFLELGTRIRRLGLSAAELERPAMQREFEQMDRNGRGDGALTLDAVASWVLTRASTAEAPSAGEAAETAFHSRRLVMPPQLGVGPSAAAPQFGASAPSTAPPHPPPYPVPPQAGARVHAWMSDGAPPLKLDSDSLTAAHRPAASGAHDHGWGARAAHPTARPLALSEINSRGAIGGTGGATDANGVGGANGGANGGINGGARVDGVDPATPTGDELFAREAACGSYANTHAQNSRLLQACAHPSTLSHRTSLTWPRPSRVVCHPPRPAPTLSRTTRARSPLRLMTRAWLSACPERASSAAGDGASCAGERAALGAVGAGSRPAIDRPRDLRIRAAALLTSRARPFV